MTDRSPETRYLDVAASAIRMETTDDGRRVIRGVALRYGSLSNPLRDGKGRAFRERFAPGAFSRALAAGADVRCLVNHNRDLVLGRSTAGTLRVSDGPEELRFEADPPDSAIGEHYRQAVLRGDMTGVSFRFYKLRDSWEDADGAEGAVRTVHEADIDDVSIVTYPAYPDTEAAARSLDEALRIPTDPRPRRDPWLMCAAVRLRLAEAEPRPTSPRGSHAQDVR